MRVIICFLIGMLLSCTQKTDSTIVKENPMGSIDNDEGLANPASGGGWSRSGTLVTQNNNQKISAQAVFPKAGPYTIQFSIDSFGEGAGGIVPECVADVEWSTAGNTVTRRISVSDGASISGNAEGVKVTVRDVSSTGTGGVEYNVSLTIAPGTRPAGSNPPVLFPAITTNPRTLAPNTEAEFTIPRGLGINSVAVLVYAPDTAAAGTPAPVIPDQEAQVFHLAPTGSIVPVLAGYDARQPGFAPLAPGADRVRVRNSSATGAGQFNIIFTLIWGIDG